jgi:hypothetical protein
LHDRQRAGSRIGKNCGAGPLRKKEIRTNSEKGSEYGSGMAKPAPARCVPREQGAKKRVEKERRRFS